VVGSLTLLQRTPAWVTPRKDRAIPPWRRALYRRAPALQQVSRAGVYAAREIVVGALLGNDRLQRLGESGARKHLAAQVADPRLRAVLTPDYRLGCKRVLLSDDFYPALARDNVRVVPSGLAAVEPDGVVTVGGERIEADTIVFGTGFHVTDMPVADLVRDGQGRTLAERWNGHPTAYRGTTVPGYPNFFLLLGPNTGLGHNSIIYMIESQLRYVVDALRARGPEPGATVEPTPEALERWTRGVDDDMRRTVWVRGGCSSWYLDRTGRNSTLWPGSTLSFRRALSRFHREDHRIAPAPRPVPAPATAVAS
jgi:cation diffusion facilitator CzcD-associated flavoprotein CzcO